MGCEGGFELGRSGFEGGEGEEEFGVRGLLGGRILEEMMPEGGDEVAWDGWGDAAEGNVALEAETAMVFCGLEEEVGEGFGAEFITEDAPAWAEEETNDLPPSFLAGGVEGRERGSEFEQGVGEGAGGRAWPEVAWGLEGAFGDLEQGVGGEFAMVGRGFRIEEELAEGLRGG